MFRRRNIVIAASAFGLGLLTALLYLREPTVPLTMERLEAARRLWQESAIRTYCMSYLMHGSRYDVDVTDGFVTSLTVNGHTLSINQPGAYSVAGLFDTLGAEIENIHDPSNPLGIPPGNVVARVRFHKTRGYPERYIRGGTGLSRGTSMEMLSFEPGERASSSNH